MMSLPTNCPQRDERKGWLGDSALTVDFANYEFSLQAFYGAWIARIVDVQTQYGGGVKLADTAPYSFGSIPAGERERGENDDVDTCKRLE